MGHKVHPKIHRMQVIYTWDSRWFGKKSYPKFVMQDIRIREYLEAKFKDAHIDGISIERGPKNMSVNILAAKPGFIIGRGGKGLEDVKKHIERKILQMALRVKINIREIKNPSLSSSVVAQTMISDIEKRVRFRRVMKQNIEKVMSAGAKGVKIKMSGRLNGVEIARTETLSAGSVPLITLRGDVDYSFKEAQTIYGKISIKVWIYKGEIFGRKDRFAVAEESEKNKVVEKKK